MDIIGIIEMVKLFKINTLTLSAGSDAGKWYSDGFRGYWSNPIKAVWMHIYKRFIK